MKLVHLRKLKPLLDICYDESIGVADVNSISGVNVTASSKYDATTPANSGRLNYASGSSWCASSRDSTPYLQVDLGSVYIICAIATQGNSQADQWVKTYQVMYSTYGSNWSVYQENGKYAVSSANNVTYSLISDNFLLNCLFLHSTITNIR